MELKIIMSKRNKPLLIYNGFVYNILKEGTVQLKWRCKLRTCTAKLISGKEKEILFESKHNHIKNEGEAEKLITLYEIYKKAKDTNENSLDIITEFTCKKKDVILEKMPRYKSIQDLITVKRNKNYNFSPKIQHDIPDFFRKTLFGDSFLRYDSGCEDEERILIFFTDKMFNILKNTKVMLSDGTFKTVPRDFYQLYTIHVQYVGKIIPAIYILMKRKTLESYEKAFDFLFRDKSFKVKYIITDFEHAPKKAFKKFLNAKYYYGCSFHFGQIVWRKLQTFDLQTLYKKDPNFKKFIRYLLSLAFIPKEDVYTTFDYISNVFEYKKFDNVARFLKYFRKNFIGSYNKNNVCKKKPFYCLNFWSCYKRVIRDIPRTINNLEAWHNNLSKKNIIAHPNLCRFLNSLQKIEEINRLRICRLSKGKFDTFKDLKREEKLRILINNYDFFEIENYLELISSLYYWDLEKK